MKLLSHCRSWFARSLILLLVLLASPSIKFAAAADIDFTQCQNDSNNDAVKDACQWVTGSLTANNSIYNESNSVPQRLFHSIATAGTHTIQLEYDFSKSNIYAYDFLTTPDLTQSGGLLNPCGNLPGFVSAPTCSALFSGKSLVPIPSDPFGSVSAKEYPSPRNFFVACSPACTGGITLSFSNLDGVDDNGEAHLPDSDPDCTAANTCSDSSVRINITFTTAQNNTIVALWFGAHLAKSFDSGVSPNIIPGWGTGYGASSISGSPFHISYASLDGDATGRRDNSMSSGAVVDLCAGAVCESDNVCVSAACVVTGGVAQCVLTPTNNGSSCEDGNACTSGETCFEGVCGNPTQTTTCTALDQCHVAGVCNTISGLCTNPPASAGTACGDQSSSVCDLPNTCDGAGSCQPNYVAQGTTCPDDGNQCTSDVCNGAGACTHPNKTAGTACGDPSSSACDLPDTCNGSGVCLANHKADGTACGDAGTECTNQDTCVAGVCHNNGFKVAGTPCGDPDNTACNAPDTCNGSGTCVDRKKSAGTVCLAGTGICDPDDVCDGTTNTCAPRYAARGTVCRAANGVCDAAETCTGNSPACPADGFILGGTCRAAAGACDVAESCDGTGPNCPTDRFKPSTSLCRAAVAACDLPEYCTGTSAACPADSFVAAGTQCRDGDGLCNPAEFCTGASGFCPGDITFAPNPDTCTLSGLGVCRTAGFWGTHGGTEKQKSINITQAVIDFALYNLAPTGPLYICGEKITTTKVYDAASALEALCVPVQGNQQLQLARQLTAAALNCAISGYYNCVGYPKYEYLFSECNTWCDPNTLDAQTVNIGYCIESLDCLNNGGTVLEGGYCKTGTCSDDPNKPCNGGDVSFCGPGAICVADVETCHDQPMCLSVGGQPIPGTPCFPETGPAGSSNACQEANKSACTIIGPNEGPAITAQDKKYMCWVDSAP